MIAKATNQAPIRLEKSRIPPHLLKYFETDLCNSCYVCHTIEILREIRRVLRKDGVVFWNIGDSYMSSPPNMHSNKVGGKGLENIGRQKRTPTATIKPKDLCLIPFRIAIAAQEDGWYIRSVIIWSKPNPMPESVTDRPTESHEYLLMLVKSGTTQFWTHRDGNREAANPDYRWINRMTNEETAVEPPNWKDKITCPACEGTGNVDKEIGWYSQEDKCSVCNGKKEITLWNRINLWRGHDYYWDADAVREPQSDNTHSRGKSPVDKNDGLQVDGKISHKDWMKYTNDWLYHPLGRNLRSVWEFPTQPYPEAHFAVFPEKLPELCIKAATPEVGCCSKCGKPWVRIIEDKGIISSALDGREGKLSESQKGRWLPEMITRGSALPKHNTETLGWQPSCNCKDATKTPSIVLDPFMGTGTTLWVAKKLGRKAVGYDISEEYCRLALERNRQYAMGI